MEKPTNCYFSRCLNNLSWELSHQEKSRKEYDVAALKVGLGEAEYMGERELEMEGDMPALSRITSPRSFARK